MSHVGLYDVDLPSTLLRSTDQHSTIYNLKPSFVISNKFTDENLPLQIVI